MNHEHQAINAASSKYAPSFVHNHKISTGKQYISQPSSQSKPVESNSGGIDSILNEIANGYRPNTEELLINNISIIPPVYDEPKSIFSVIEMMDFNNVEPIVANAFLLETTDNQGV